MTCPSPVYMAVWVIDEGSLTHSSVGPFDSLLYSVGVEMSVGLGRC